MAAQQQQQSGSDTSMAPVWITALAFITGFVIWSTAHTSIVSFVFFLNVWQAKVVHFFIGQTTLANDIHYMQSVNPARVTWAQLVDLTHNVGTFTRYPVMVILFILGFFLYRSDITLKYRKTHDMKTLRAQEQANWSSIMPIVKEDLVSQDIDVGPFAMALTPMEFARKYALLKKDDLLLDNPTPGEEMTAGIRRGDAKRVFTLQLGPYWSGFEQAAPHARALAAVFMARINRDRGSATYILDKLNASYAAGAIDYSVATATLKKYQGYDNIQKIISRHAYLLTAMASLLAASRDDGVVPSAEFLWLKPVDRRLWYMLNCVGRQTPFSEVAGPYAHWRAELAMGRRSLVPMIDEAIKALEIAVKEVKLSPNELEALRP